MKIALACDWLTNIGGAERVLKTLHDIYPEAPIYTSQYNKKGINWFNDADVRTGWLQIFPSSLRRFLGPLRQIYFSHLDLSDYDLIISVTGAEAKAIKKGNAKHVCYCHVPTQYYWQFYDEYVKNPGFGILNPLVRVFFKLLVKPLRKADYKSAQLPDQFVTISKYSAGLIKQYYGRESVIIAPPVNVRFFSQKEQHKKGKSQAEVLHKPVENSDNTTTYITTSRQVTWKRLDLAVKACLKNNQPLTLIGDGPEHNNLIKLAKNSPLITFLPTMDQTELKKHLAKSKAYLFPSLEPFGIAPVEALAAGCPVIAYGEGGALDYIKDGENGLLFDKQSVSSLSAALKKFEHLKLSATDISTSAKPFSTERFSTQIKDLVHEKTHSK